MAAAIAGPGRLLSGRPSQEGRGAALSDIHKERLTKAVTSPSYPTPMPRSGGQNGLHEPGDILRGELDPDRRPECIDATQTQILIEIAHH